MSVDRARGLYHCFGCGKGGDVFSFVQETQGVDFADALELLAWKVGSRWSVTQPTPVREDAAAKQSRPSKRRSTSTTTDSKKASEAGPARAYLRQRGYDVGIIDELEIWGSPGPTGTRLPRSSRRADSTTGSWWTPDCPDGDAKGCSMSSGAGSCSPFTTFVVTRSGLGVARSMRSIATLRTTLRQICQLRRLRGLSQGPGSVRARPGPPGDLRRRSGSDRRGVYRRDRHAPGRDQNRRGNVWYRPWRRAFRSLAAVQRESGSGIRLRRGRVQGSSSW